MRDGAVKDGRSGAVVVVQRTSADLKLNPHLHGLFLDGVYTLGSDGSPSFRALPRLSTSEVADVLQVVRVRLLRHFVRHRVIEAGPEATLIEDQLAEREPALAQLACAAVSGLPPAGPELRRRPVQIPLRGRPGVVVSAPLSVAEMGFSLHAATLAGAEDTAAREALVKYILRPPIANERLRWGPDDLVRIELRKPFRDGTVAIDIDPLSLLIRLSTAVPPPRFHTLRYAGVLAAAATLRPLVVPPPRPAPAPEPGAAPSPDLLDQPPPTHRCRYRPYAELLKRSFAVDLICEHCGAPMKLLALVKDPSNIARYLRHLGEPTEPPPLAPARAPPFFKSRLLRRRPATQQPLFDHLEQ
jgi:hypothetical protein